jgi:DtxR family Mn-dependent transcriptional regulator
MDLDAVHDEADRLEHHVSEDMEARIAAALGFPEFDPHGDPIPSPELQLAAIDDEVLGNVASCSRAHVTRVSDRDAEIVRELVAVGILPGVELTNVASADSGAVMVELADGRTVAIGPGQAGAVRVRCLD